MQAVFLAAKVGRMDAFISRLVRWQILQCFAEGPSTLMMGADGYHISETMIGWEWIPKKPSHNGHEVLMNAEMEILTKNRAMHIILYITIITSSTGGLHFGSNS